MRVGIFSAVLLMTICSSMSQADKLVFACKDDKNTLTSRGIVDLDSKKVQGKIDYQGSDKKRSSGKISGAKNEAEPRQGYTLSSTPLLSFRNPDCYYTMTPNFELSNSISVFNAKFGAQQYDKNGRHCAMTKYFRGQELSCLAGSISTPTENALANFSTWFWKTSSGKVFDWIRSHTPVAP